MQGAVSVRHCGRLFLRVALIGALVASLGLTACGRKGPLDPPPGGSFTGAQVTPTSNDKPLYGPDGKVLVPAGTKKPIPLDVLLN
jgi:predicted small lipoprotein YifL